MKNRIDSSRKKTPWDNKENLSATEKFIRNKYIDNYNNKHPKLIETNEADLLNSIKLNTCKYCNSEKVIKKGFTKNNIQRYFCKYCGKYFCVTTNTIFENHKIAISEWIEFLLDIFNHGSTTLTSKVNKNGMNTSLYWLHKTFLVLKEYQNSIVLSGTVYIDETYYKVRKNDIIKKQNGKEFKGISYNQYCIALGYDGNNIIALSEGLGKTSSNKTKTAFINHIEKGSVLIHDEEKSHNILIEELNLKNKTYNSSELKGISDKNNPLRPINHQCDLLKQFLNAHSGFDREDLQDYLNLYCFINSGHKNKLEKVNDLLITALKTNITLKYRDLFSIIEKNH